MRRTGRRVLTAVVGAVLFGVYLVAAFLSYRVLVGLWRSLSDPLATLAVALLASLVLGYVQHRIGTARLLAGLDADVLPRDRAPGVHARLDRLCECMNVSRPDLMLVRIAEPNALALGSGRRGVVALDPTMFRLLSGDEFEAVLAHELAHLEGRHDLRRTLAFGLLQTAVGAALVALVPAVLVASGAVRALAWFRGRPGRSGPAGRAHVLLGRIGALALVALVLFARARSRRNEFAADDRAAEVTGNPLALARALRKIESASESVWRRLLPWYGRDERDDPLVRLFSTHPSTDERVRRLVERAEKLESRRWRRIPVEQEAE